jgi:hypothetical protein
MAPEDPGIYSDDDGYHRHHVSHGNHRSCHCDEHQIQLFGASDYAEFVCQCVLVQEASLASVFYDHRISRFLLLLLTI